jgi:hypothetical protein
MNTNEPVLTTAQLLDACQSATGVRFSVHQLGDYVHEGWLFPSRPGKGRGRREGGTDPRQWPVANLPRLIVIAQSCTGKNVNKRRAAAALLKAGYSPGPTYLRQVLRDLLDDWDAAVAAPLKRNRPYLDRPGLSLDEQRKRFHRSEQRRYGAVDPKVRDKVRDTVERVKLILLGLAEAPGGDALAEVVAVFTAPCVRASLMDASTAEIAQAFADVEWGLPAVAHATHAYYEYLTAHEDHFATLMVQERERVAFAAFMRLLREIVAAGPEALVKELGLPLTLVALHMRKQSLQEGFDQKLLEAMMQASTLLHMDLEAAIQVGFQAGAPFALPAPLSESTHRDGPPNQDHRPD